MSIIIRLQNLPWAANSVDIRRYFSGLSIPEGGVHIVGGEKGDAFIAFSTDEDARQAMERDGGKIKDMKVKLLLSSRAEMTRVIEQARNQTLSLQTPAVVKAAANDSDRRKIRDRSPSPSRSRKDREKSPSRERRKTSYSKRDRSRSRSRSPPRKTADRDRDVDRRNDRGKRDDRPRYDERDPRYKSSRDYNTRDSNSQDRKLEMGNKTKSEPIQNKPFDPQMGATPQTFDSMHLDGGGSRTGSMEFNPRQGNLPHNSASFRDSRNEAASGSSPSYSFPAAVNVAPVKQDIKQEPMQPTAFPALDKISSLFDNIQPLEARTSGNYETKRPSPTPAALAPKVESNPPYMKGYGMSSRADPYNSMGSNFGNCPDPTASTYGTGQTAEKGAIPAVPHDRKNVLSNKPVYGAEPHARYEQIPEANQASKSSTAPIPADDSGPFGKRLFSMSSTGAGTAMPPNMKPRRSRFEPEVSTSQEIPYSKATNDPRAASAAYSSRHADATNRSRHVDNPSSRENLGRKDPSWLGHPSGASSSQRPALLTPPQHSGDFPEVDAIDVDNGDDKNVKNMPPSNRVAGHPLRREILSHDPRSQHPPGYFLKNPERSENLSLEEPRTRADIQSRASQPPLNEPRHGPPLNEPIHGPPLNEPIHGPPINEPGHGSSINEPRHGLPLNEPRHGLPLNEPRHGPSLNEPRHGPSLNDPRRGPPLNEPRRGPPLNEPRRGPPLNEPRRGSPIIEPMHDSPINESRHGSSINDVRRGPPLNEPRHGSSINELRRGSPINEPRHGSSMNEPRHGSSMNEPRHGSSMNEPRHGSSMNEPRHGSSMNEPRHGSSMNEPRHGSSMNEPRHGSSMNESRHGLPFNDPRLGSSINEPRRGSPMNESRHGPPMNESRHGPPMNESRHGPPMNESRHGPPMNESRHGPPINESRHGPPMSDPRRGSSINEPRHGSPLNQSEGLHPGGRNEGPLKRGLSSLTVVVNNLPYDVTENDILGLFRGIFVGPENFKLTHDSRGLPSAFVKFMNPRDYEEALSRSRQKNVADSCPEIIPCSLAEFENGPAFTAHSRVDNIGPPPQSLRRQGLRPQEEDLCVELEGLPASCIEDDIVQFFDGLGILDIVMQEYLDHRGNKVCYVEFGTPADFHAALNSTGKMIGHRCISVIVSSKERMNIAQTCKRIKKEPMFLSPSRDPVPSRVLNKSPRSGPLDGPMYCVVINGLPEIVKNRDIADFFADDQLFPRAIHIMLDSKKLPSGEAFAEFATIREFEIALQRDGKYLAGCRVSLNPIAYQAMTEILKGPSSIPVPLLRSPPDDRPIRRALMPMPPPREDDMNFRDRERRPLEDMPPDNFGPNRQRAEPRYPPNEMPFDHPGSMGTRPPFGRIRAPVSSRPGNRPQRPPIFGADGPPPRFSSDGPSPRFGGDGPPQRFRPTVSQRGPPVPQSNGPQDFGMPGCVVAINNLHFRAGLDEIMDAFQGFPLDKDKILRKYNDKGQATGEARIAFRCHEDAVRAVEELNQKVIFGRPIYLSMA